MSSLIDRVDCINSNGKFEEGYLDLSRVVEIRDGTSWATHYGLKKSDFTNFTALITDYTFSKGKFYLVEGSIHVWAERVREAKRKQ